jgi:hypothetical protein
MAGVIYKHLLYLPRGFAPMNARLEEFTGDYVVVPLFEAGSFGIVNVVRGDMTDKEWGVWNRIRSAPEIKEAISKSPRPSETPGRILAVLENKGIQRCLTNMERPTL